MSANSSNDVIEVDEDVCGPAPDDETIRKTREKCHTDINALQTAEETGETLPIEKLEALLIRSNDDADKIRTPREGILDTNRLKLVSGHRAKIVGDMQQGHKFDPDDFARAMLSCVNVGNAECCEDDDPHPEWLKFGRFLDSIFCPAPNFEHINGAYDAQILGRDPVQKQKREKATKAKIDKNAAKSVEMVDKAKQVTADSTKQGVDIAYEKLKAYLKEHNNKMCYFKFVTDPNSFGRTVLTMFHVSFLVKEGLVGIGYDAYKLPILYLPGVNVEATEAMQASQEAVARGDIDAAVSSQQQADHATPENRQVVIDINMDQWEDIVKTFKINESFLSNEEFTQAVVARQHKEAQDAAQQAAAAHIND